MGLLSKIFKKKNIIDVNNTQNNNISHDKDSIDYKKIQNFIKKYNNLISQDKFLSRSEFNNLKEEYKTTFDKFKVISNLNKYATDNNLNKELLEEFIFKYNDLNCNYVLVKEHNNKYIDNHLNIEKEYFDDILKQVDPNVLLDEEQRRVCLDDEDYSLIIAGAGAGKTTTLAAKVKYLIDRKGIDPKDILIIAFTNQAVNELKDKITKKLGYAVPISTFHSCGRAIVKKDVNYADTSICSDNFYFIKDYLGKLVERDNNLLSELIMLFAYYLDLPEDITKNISLEDHFTLIETSDYTTIKHNIQEYINKNQKMNKSIQNEILKSTEEVQIANFLFLNNIEYEYEKPYKFPIPYANKIYTPDFYIKQGDNECYIEHFGITEDGKNNRYTEEELKKYIINMKYKIIHHENHDTKLIRTYSKFNDGRALLDHLKEDLEKNGFTLVKKDDQEIYEAIMKNKDNKYMYKFCNIAS